MIDHKKENKCTNDLHNRNKQIFRSMMGKFRNIKKITDQFAHHLTGIVLTVIGERKLLIMVKKLLAHIPFHVRSHHMSLITYIIFAETLDQVHQEKS